MQRMTLRLGAIGALVALTLGGCSDFRTLFSAHADTAAEAGSMELPTEQLAGILATAKRPQPITREAAEYLAGTWVEYALFALAVTRGELPTDSASIAEAMWPELAELKGTRFHDTLLAQRSALSDSAADSLYRADVRVFQHILFGMRPNTPEPARAATKRKAEGTLARVKRGADFGSLASTLSEDGASKADSGYLPPGPRGRFVAAFDSVGWTLTPGQVSGLVETPFGFHIIRRPALKDVRGRLAGYLESRAGARLDSLFMDSLSAAHDITVESGAASTMRAVSESPEDYRTSEKVLVRFRGGDLTTKEYLRWVRALPPHLTAQLRQAHDTMLAQFAKVITQNVLLLRTAESAGIEVTPEEWAGLRQRFLAQLDTLKMEMDLTSPDLTDSTIALSEREKIAALKVQKYFEGLVDRKVRLRPIAPSLAGLLREKMPYEVVDAGINRAVALADERRSATDTTAGAQARGMMQRAPGPAPVPGAGAAPAESAPPAPPAGAAPAVADSARK
jgi:PPIC-type PPIASE domain